MEAKTICAMCEREFNIADAVILGGFYFCCEFCAFRGKKLMEKLSRELKNMGVKVDPQN